MQNLVLPTIVISREAIALIEQESRSATMETGGVLFGVTGGEGTIIITHATRPGPNAYHAPASFEKDLQYQQALLDEMNKKYNVDYVGEWHKHLGNMNCPSQGDLSTALSILRDPEWNKQRLVLIIANLAEDQVYVSSFFISRNIWAFVETEAEVIPLKGMYPEKSIASPVREVLVSQDKIAGAQVSGHSNDANQWFETRDGKKRLAEEKRLLEDTGVSFKSILREDGRLCFVIPTKNTLQFDEIIMTFPRDYPNSPPDIAIQYAGTLIALRALERVAWDPSLNMSDLAFDLLNSESPVYEEVVSELRDRRKGRVEEEPEGAKKREDWLNSCEGRRRIKEEKRSLRKVGAKRIHTISTPRGVIIRVANAKKGRQKFSLIFECLESGFPESLPEIMIEYKKERIPVSLGPDFVWNDSKHLGEIAEYILDNLKSYLSRGR